MTIIEEVIAPFVLAVSVDEEDGHDADARVGETAKTAKTAGAHDTPSGH